MGLKNKKILITAGPTWVPIDKVRVISNTASAETGLLLASRLAEKGARVTLVLGPAGCALKDKKIKVINFRFFDELARIISRELRTGRYRAVIHSAAVSDYRPLKQASGKIKSGMKELRLILGPTPKIIDRIKKAAPDVFLVGFKFEPGTGKARLLESARGLMRRARLDAVVANTVSAGKYKAYILSSAKTRPLLSSKGRLAARLIEELKKSL